MTALKKIDLFPAESGRYSEKKDHVSSGVGVSQLPVSMPNQTDDIELAAVLHALAGFELHAIKGQRGRQAQLELTEDLPRKQTTRAPQEGINGDSRLAKREWVISGSGEKRLFPFLDLCRSDLAELDGMDFSQPFGPAAGVMIVFCRVTRETKRSATIFRKAVG